MLFNSVLIRKMRTHALSGKMVAQRFVKDPRFLKPIYHRKWLSIITGGEAWCYLTHVNGKTEVVHKFRGKQNPEAWRKILKAEKVQGRHVSDGNHFPGLHKIRFVPPKAKVNVDFYKIKALKPLFEIDIPNCWGRTPRTSFFTMAVRLPTMPAQL